jgi:DnaA family protein
VRQLPLGLSLRAQAVFANFSVGENREVLAALRAPGRHPLWLYGVRGSGKTHLLQAMCAEAGETAAYLSLDPAFGLPPQALGGYERCRVVCIDDADAVAGRREWEEALLHLFIEAAEARSRLVFASRPTPRQVGWLLGDWRSRALACVLYQVRELDEAGRAEALRLRAAQRGLALPIETLDYLMRRVPRDLTSLLEVLDTLDAASLAEQRRLTIPFIRAALERHAGTKPVR